MHFLMVTHGIGAAALSRNYVRWGCAALLSILISSAWPGSVTAAGGATGNEAAESRSSVSAVERLKLFEGDLKPRQWSNLFGVKTCTAKDSVLESWVCDDPAAGFMDADLAESGRISASELGQLRRRIAVRCLPPSPAARLANSVTYPQRWTIAACLRASYYGVWQTHVEPYGARYRPWSRIASLHPACIRDLLDYPDQVGGISFEICDEKFGAVPFRTIGDGIGRTSSVLYPGWGAIHQPVFRYQQGGTIKDGVLALGTYDSRGGASIDSGIAFVRLDNSLTLALEGWEYLGDRCNRGLKFVRAEEAGPLSVTVNITSYDLFALDDWRRPREHLFTTIENEYHAQGLLLLRPYEDLENFANVDCLGSAEYTIDLPEKMMTLRSVTIARTVELMADRFVYQQCFNEFIANRFTELPVTIDAAGLAPLAHDFNLACVDAGAD